MLALVRRSLRRLRLLARRGAHERAMDEEMRFHLEMEASELERLGLAPPEARRRARVSFGGVERFKEAARDERGTRLVEDLWQDFGYALHQLRASPGFAAATVLTLALGIGTTTMMHGIRRSELGDGATLTEADRLVYLGQGPEGCLRCVTLSAGNYLTVLAETRVLEHVSLIADWEPVMRGTDGAELVDAARVSTNFFQTLGVRPVLGRTLLPDDSASDRNQVVVLSEANWKARFAADSSVLGRTVVLDRVPYTVVGVAPDEASFWPRGTGVWTPLVLEPEQAADRTSTGYRAVGRLREDAQPETAALEARGIGARLAAALPDDLSGSTLVVTPLLDFGRNQRVADPATLIFRAALGLVLLIACINLAGLLIARLGTRRRELAVRRALGASSARVARQLVAETVLLTALAGLGGVLIAAWSTRVLLGGTLPLDWQTFGIALLMGLMTGLLIALWPSVSFARPPVVEELRQSTRLASGGLDVARGRRALVVAEVALSIVVLTAAGVLARSFQNIYDIAPGFRGDRLLTLRVSNPLQGSESGTAPTPIDDLVVEIAAIPGVESAGATVGVPFSHGAGSDDFEVAGRPPTGSDGQPSALMQAATPAYFETLGIPILRGRPFDESDDADGVPVAIINRTLAERVFPDEDPIGRGLIIDEVRWDVVGVVGDVFHGDVEQLREPEIYRPMQQWSTTRAWIAVRTRGEPASIAPALVATVGRFDPDMVVTRMLTMDELRATDMGSELRMLRLMGAFALAAVLISAIGLYGLISYSVTQRVREFGVRLALGAPRAALLRLVLLQGVRLAGLGAVLGTIGALTALPVMRSMLFGVSPSDPATLAAVAGFICAIGLLAAYLPARRATLVNPISALGEE